MQDFLKVRIALTILMLLPIILLFPLINNSTQETSMVATKETKPKHESEVVVVVKKSSTGTSKKANEERFRKIEKSISSLSSKLQKSPARMVRGKTKRSSPETTEIGRKLAQKAEEVARKINGRNNCYDAVANRVIQPIMNIALWGKKASNAKRLMSLEENRKYFREIDIDQENFDELPIGTIVVWGWSPYNGNKGHISIIVKKEPGKVIEASDHINKQRTIKDGYRYGKAFIPLKSKPKPPRPS